MKSANVTQALAKKPQNKQNPMNTQKFEGGGDISPHCQDHCCLLVHPQQGFPYVCCSLSQHLVTEGSCDPYCFLYVGEL